jgi:hypothetical protein
VASRTPQKKNKQRNAPQATTNAGIPLPHLPEGERPLKFSFKHLDIGHPKFNPAECSVGFYCALLDKIKEYSSWTVEGFCEANGNDRRHQIYFPETSEQQGFALLADEQFADTESWQFCLLQTREWRVHGFILADTFYVVWLDENHALYGDEID